MSDMGNDPVDMEEPRHGEFDQEDNIWLRGLYMLVFLFLFTVAEFILGVVTLIQFLWMLFAKERNEVIVDFGASLGQWLEDVAAFQTARSEDKPFPWKKFSD